MSERTSPHVLARLIPGPTNFSRLADAVSQIPPQPTYREETKTLWGESSMTAYVVAGVRKRNSEVYKQYLDKAVPSLLAGGGKIIAFCESPTVLEGVANVDRVVVMEFSDRGAAERWYRSKAYYDDSLPLRLASSDTAFFTIIENDAPESRERV